MGLITELTSEEIELIHLRPMELEELVGRPLQANAFTHPEIDCPCVTVHRPTVITFHQHHIKPFYLGGEDVEENTIYICPTMHASVHHYIRVLEKTGGVDIPWSVRNRFSVFCQALSWRGYR